MVPYAGFGADAKDSSVSFLYAKKQTCHCGDSLPCSLQHGSSYMRAAVPRQTNMGGHLCSVAPPALAADI